MKVCILGSGLVSLSLAKALINLKINVDIFSNSKIKKQNKIRTIGISKNNVDFFNNNVLDIDKILWNINKIEIFNDKFIKEKLISFENEKKPLFSLIKNYKLYNLLLTNLNKSRFSSFKIGKQDLLSIANKYNLIINCELDNRLTKKYFHKKIYKDYLSYAHTTIIKHQNLNNNSAKQIFTKNGPLAFLPLSNNETSIVYSARGEKKINLKRIIDEYNSKYQISKLGEINSFKLISNNLRNYHYRNILAFGELLHQIHPLAGQGFNMSIRDIKELVRLIKFKLDLGLDLDKSICLDFEKNIKHKNYIFSRSIDFIYEFFNLDRKIKNTALSKSLQFIGKNKLINNSLQKLANEGFNI